MLRIRYGLLHTFSVLAYTAKELDRSVVVKSQNRTVLQAFRDALKSELFLGRSLVPKALIFCKDDSHADDVVHICAKSSAKATTSAKRSPTNQSIPRPAGRLQGEQLIQEWSEATPTRQACPQG